MVRRKKPWGPVVYYVVRTATHIQTGDKSVSRYGPYRTHGDAEAKLREDEEAMPVGIPQYEYEYKIEPEVPDLNRK